MIFERAFWLRWTGRGTHYFLESNRVELHGKGFHDLQISKKTAQWFLIHRYFLNLIIRGGVKNVLVCYF